MKTTLCSAKILAASFFVLNSLLAELRITIGRKDVAKTVVSLTSVTILLMSSAVITMLSSAVITNAQSNDVCKKLNITDITESSHNANSVAANAIDMKSDTRWAENISPSYIQVDLGQKTLLCSIDISWYRGESRSYNFVISISDDGITFKDILSGKSTGDTSSPERYNLANNQARYVRTTVYGNSENDDWASINEMAVNGLVCSAPQISEVTASGNQEPNTPQNTLDNNTNTRWSNFGFPSWVQYDLGESQPICNVDIAWYRGNLRVNTFTISVSNDGINFTPIFSGKSSGETTGLERYNVPDTMGRYMRITVAGNTENSWSSITEVRINGGAIMECQPPQISGVEAIGNDGNVPQNTIDNNLNTRWSNLGFPSWVQYDLGESQPICNVDIAWYRGNLRVNTFTISVSSDGINFTPIFSGKSSGETTGLEPYNIPDTMGRYMRITVTGNTENSWSSISEAKINGEPQTTPPSPPPPSPGTGSDQFGIKKIYPTKANGEEWFMDMSDGQDSRSRPPSMTKNSDGSFKVTSSQVRYNVFTSAGYNPDEIELDHGILADRGYMQSPEDWRDVELTGYVKVNSGDSGENFAWYARGGRHTGSGNPEGCEGSSIKSDLFYDGRVRFAKEQWHVSYVFTDHKRPVNSIEDRWVGFKGIMYNIEQNGETAVKMEIWVDNNEDGQQDGPWVKVDENIDSGGWGDNGEECGGEPDQIITWGGPIATFRWDGASNVDIKNFSVREIQPPS
jgi:F5/8 type C domain